MRWRNHMNLVKILMVQLIFMKGRLLLTRTMLSILNNIGNLHWKNDKPNDAAIAFERAIEIDPFCTTSRP